MTLTTVMYGMFGAFTENFTATWSKKQAVNSKHE